MPLEDTTGAEVEAFKVRKKAQWTRVMGTIDGMQMVQSGERATQFVITGPTGERVIYGQLPHVVTKWIGTGPHRQQVRVENDRKPVEKRAIDLTDDQLDAVIAAWSRGATAGSLGFIETL